jgi:hypothetical protein
VLGALGLFVSSLAWAQPVRHLALFVGNDEGGDGTRPLFYAKDDARRLHQVFERLGAVAPDDGMLLLDQQADDVLTALGELERRARDAHARGESTTLFFYYSGHAKDGALRLGDTRLPLEALKQRLAGGPADVRVAVFDACRSGAINRAKGARKAPAFEVESDATRAAKGIVILSSSAADEDAQESDTIGASYFSYHLATGLLGSADQNGDGRVSLTEAYAWAYERTVASTADSAGGPQHPTFSFDLAGNGDLVLTEVAERREGVRLAAGAPAGTYFVVDPKGVMAAEVVKADDERLVALPPGNYVVKRRLSDHLRIGRLTVKAGEVTTLDEATFRDAPFSADPVKGTARSTLYAAHWSLAASGQWLAVFDRPTSSGGHFPSSPEVGGTLTRHNFFGQGFSLELDAAYGWANGTVATALVDPLAYTYTHLSFGAGLSWESHPENTFVPFVGVHLALNSMSRDFGSTLPVQHYTTLTPGLSAGLKWRFTGNFSLVARGRLHYLLYNVDETRSLGTADVGLLLDYEFKD